MVALAVTLPAAAAGAAVRHAAPTVHRQAAPMPKAWMLVDADTGAVISAGDEREALPPASTTKVITALVAVHSLPADADIPVSARAEATPATKINMKAGQTWTLDDTLHALLMSSANDAAVALAERVAGSVEAFQSDMYDEAARLNMADNPVLLDPAGLDDSFSVGGGNRVSARDLAIAARALLADPELSKIVAENIARFTGGDGIAHRLVNHNNMIRHYDGAIGVKTGWTVKAGHCLIAAARRNGRTMLSVVMDAPDMYVTSAALLDQGFTTPVSTEATMSHLPPIPAGAPHGTAAAKAKPKATKSTSNALPAGAAALTSPEQASVRHSGRWGNLLINIVGAIALVLALLRARVRWVRRKRRHARLGHTPSRGKVRAPKPPREPRLPKPAPTPEPVVIEPAAGLWDGRSLEEWDRPLVSH